MFVVVYIRDLVSGLNVSAVGVGWHCKYRYGTLRGASVHVKWFF